jgi:SOS-response transcriptional repressor LexA
MNENTYGSRLLIAMEARNATRKDLAAALGVSVQAVGDVLRGKSSAFTAENNAKAAQFLRVDPNWLATGEGGIDAATLFLSESNQPPALTGRAGTAINLIEDVCPVEFSIPLLSWVRAGAFCEAPGSFTREDAQELLPRPLFRTGPNTFALTVVGDSMDVPDGYREGEIVYIDPDIEPTPGKDVLAKADGKMTLKRYKVDDEGPYLLQLNGNRIIRPTDWGVCGVVVYAGRRC